MEYKNYLANLWMEVEKIEYTIIIFFFEFFILIFQMSIDGLYNFDGFRTLSINKCIDNTTPIPAKNKYITSTFFIGSIPPSNE